MQPEEVPPELIPYVAHRQVKITTLGEFKIVATALVMLRSRRDGLESEIKPLATAAYQQWKRLKSREKEALDPLVEVEERLRQLIADWRESQDTDAELPAEYTVVDNAEITYASQWKAKVTDKMAIIQAVARGDIGPEYIDINMKEVNAKAKDLREAISDGIPGTESVHKFVVGVRKEKEVE